MRNILITGGAGFIGANFVAYWVKKHPNDKIVVLDALTYAGNLSSIKNLIDDKKIHFSAGDICDAGLVRKIFVDHSIDTIVHFAAESHVDRSIADPSAFIRTNIVGTFNLLSIALEFWKGEFTDKRFHHISTDEVYGDLGPEDPAFTELTSYVPRSPYAASKASSDLLVRAYFTTYGLPVTISNCSNNYGPFQFPEKLIPLMLINALSGKPLPVYGKGDNVRDWLYVEDHCIAIEGILERGEIGQTYNVGGENEIVNLDLVRELCGLVDTFCSQDELLRKRFPNSPASHGKKCDSLIAFVKDRPGHDRRYAINQAKIRDKLGFSPSVNFKEGLASTVSWYLNQEDWWKSILSGDHQKWLESHYGR